MTEIINQPHASPSINTDYTVQVLRDALTNKNVLHEPWTSDVIPLSRAESTLFYKRQDGIFSAIDLFSTTSAQGEELSNACKPATFGLNQKDVLDLSYRKAGKLDIGDFFWGFNPDSGDIIQKIVAGLFPWKSLDKGVRFELYKLNVYGKGSFFKTHQHTPRSQGMFGSLVVVFPFSHKGGNLLLRHHGREYAFNGSPLLQETPVPSAAYIAFFSDVEHEVTPVESGYRVTVTYNLYFDPKKGAPILQAPNSNILSKRLLGLSRTLLSESNFFHSAFFDSKELKPKGSDAILIQILSDLGVKFRFYVLYFEWPLPRGRKCPFRLLSQTIIRGNQDRFGYDQESSFDVIADRRESFNNDSEDVVEDSFDSDWYASYLEDHECYRSEHVYQSVTVAYGNEAGLEYFYHQLCVVATIARPEQGGDAGSISDEMDD